MIYEYLERINAIGERQAASTKSIMLSLNVGRRELVKFVASERAAGRLICSSSRGGYYLPANNAEIIAQKKRLEKTFISRANAVRVFRHACKDIERKGAAGTYGTEKKEP